MEQNDPRAVPRLESGSISKLLQYWQQTLKEWNARNLQKRSLLFVPQFLPRCTHTGQVRFKTKSYNHIHANIFYEMKKQRKNKSNKRVNLINAVIRYFGMNVLIILYGS